MLERLDEVRWSTLTHAYGSAEDLPGLLRDLASSDRDEREAALAELHGNVWHQGTVYPATPHVVPFLLELLAEPELAGKAELLLYLGRLARAEAEAPGLASRVTDAVRQGAPIYEVLLDDPAPDVRPAAASLLGVLGAGPTGPAPTPTAPDELDDAALRALQALAAAEAGPASAPAADPAEDPCLLWPAALGLSLLFLAVVALLVLLALGTRP